MKMKCIETVEFMGVEVYTEGKVYKCERDVVEGEVKGYKINGNGGFGYVSIEDEVLNNFEEYKESYQIKAIYNGDVSHSAVSVFDFNGEMFIHISDVHTEKEKTLSYYLDDVICNSEWTLFEVFNDTVKRIKRKNIELALEKYTEINE